MTSAGALRGVRLGDGLVGFRGVPYAAPPVGRLRWRPPAPVEQWPGVRDATVFGADAVQVPGVRRSRAPGMSEDCLFLNVWAPAARRESGWPVIVWSGGGAFSTGGGAFAEEDPARLAARGAVVVTFNARLGIFGFLAHEALTAESPVGSSGNYGLMDCAAVLRWVRENAGAFGGDPGRVTYMAESSGAAAGLLLLTAPLERGLFDRAVLLSPGSVTPLLPLAAAERSAVRLGGTADELRAVPAETLLGRTRDLAAAPSNLSVARPLRPIVDGWLITSDQGLLEGDADCPAVIIGTNEDEGRFFTRRMALASPHDYERYLSETFGPRADEARAWYPLTPGSDVAAPVAQAYGDVSINHPADRILHAVARRQPQTFRLVYTYRHEGTDEPPTHSEEAATFLDSRLTSGGADAEVADLATRYLLAFAERGDPNGPGLVAWPPFDGDRERYLQLDRTPTAGSRWRGDHMRFLSDLSAPDPRR